MGKTLFNGDGVWFDPTRFPLSRKGSKGWGKTTQTKAHRLLFFLGSGSGKKAKGRGRLNACGCGGNKILLEVYGEKGKERNSEIERGGKNCMCAGVSGVVSVCVSLNVLGPKLGY